MMKTCKILALALVSVFFIQWKPLDKSKKVLPKKIRENWAFVSAGKALVEADTALVDAFFIQTTEVTNSEYRRFIAETAKRGENTSQWQVDTTVWVREFTFGEPYRLHFYRHPAYDNYPVVGISYEGAMAFCRWKQAEMQQQLGGEYDVSCKLPSREEWIRAARGDKHWAVYSWGGPRICNAQGCVLCNYSLTGDESVSIPIGEKVAQVYPSRLMGVAGHLSDNADILAPVNAYAVNDVGCTNMNGNAAELLEGGKWAAGGSWRNTGFDVRNESILNYTQPVSYVGFRVMMTLKPKI